MSFVRENTLLSFVVGSYISAFTVYFLISGNYEFIWYVIVMVGFAWLIASTSRISKLPSYLLWMLALWGFMHMAGGGVWVGGHKLYDYVLIPFITMGDFTIFRYDQLVHAYGFGVGALVVEYLLRQKIQGSIPAFWLGLVAILASMGLSVVNEIVEFVAVLTLPSTDVGGYYNTLLDLLFNTVGAITAVVVAGPFHAKRRQ